MTKKVEATLTQRKQDAGSDRLLRNCLTLGEVRQRPSARQRLEDAIGPEFARRLVASLTARSPRE